MQYTKQVDTGETGNGSIRIAINCHRSGSRQGFRDARYGLEKSITLPKCLTHSATGTLLDAFRYENLVAVVAGDAESAAQLHLADESSEDEHPKR